MKTLFYSTRDFEKPYLSAANKNNLPVIFSSLPLSADTAWQAGGFDIVSIFTSDDASAPVIEKLSEYGVRFIAVRAAGYDNVDLAKAKEKGIQVANVPAYSPYSIAEHALALMLALNRKLVTASEKVHRHNFTIDNLVGFDLNKKTVGVIGTGKIGGVLIKILNGLGCRVLAYDTVPNLKLADDYQVTYVSLESLCRQADIVSIHTCLTPQTKYIINKDNIALMKPGVMLINTSRGACINTADILHYLETGHIGYFGTDVYEKERGIFFYDRSDSTLNDDVLEKLLSMPNVLVTPHQGFATREAIGNIMATTFYNMDCWATQQHSENELIPTEVVQNFKPVHAV
jgi:D-lactate dehydrogenase